MKRIVLLLALLVLSLTGCHQSAQLYRPVVEDTGETYLYLARFPQEASRLSFTVDGVWAERADGVEVPLAVQLPQVVGPQMGRQRFLASASLPAGSYRGLAFRVKRASLRGEEGEVALLVPEGASRLSFPFEVRKGKGLLISLGLDYQRSLKDGVRFDPVFAPGIPGKPLVGLTGYVTNFGSNTITVFDKKRGEAVDLIQTGPGPAAIVLDQLQRRAYVAVSGEDAIAVIDVQQGVVVDRILLNQGDAPRNIALTPDGKVLISANSGSNTVSLLDPVARTETARIFLKLPPEALLVDRTGRRAYIFHTRQNSISVLDIASRTVTSIIQTDPTPVRGDFTRKGDRLVLFYELSPYLALYDAISLSLVKRVYDDIGIGWVKVDTNTDRVYVGKKESETVEIFDPFSLVPSDALAAAGGVSFMTIDNDENNLLLMLPESRRLQIVNLVSRKTMGEIDLAETPYWLTVMGER